MRITTILIVFILGVCMYAQNWNGTWEWQNGNQTFQLFINEEVNSSEDLYLLIKFRMLNNQYDSIIYASSLENEPFEWYWPLSLSGNNNLAISVLFMDFTHDNDRTTFKSGVLKLYYQDCDTSGCQPTLLWKLRPPKDAIAPQGSPEEFNLPTDMILTKVE